MNKRELPYFNIGRSYGGNQNWFLDFWMHIGGCGALTMCDLMIYMAKHQGRHECIPFDVEEITRKDYVRFGMEMKPFLRPRDTGIKDLETFMDGAMDYLQSNQIRGLEMEGFSGYESYEAAAKVLKQQIDDGIPVPMLMLKHRNSQFSFFEWHWFLIVGYEERKIADKKVLYAKAATYGREHWLRFDQFWNTGEEERGGLVLVKDEKSRQEIRI